MFDKEPRMFDEELMKDRHPSTQSIAQFFTYEHLPPHLQPVSQMIAEVANDAIETIPDSPELTAGLRKLLEAKDCLVRAALQTSDVGVRNFDWRDR